MTAQKASSQQLVLDLPFETALGEDDFVVSAGNLQAYEYLMGMREWPGSTTLLIGPEKSGKTHLASIWAGQSGALVLNADHPEKWPQLMETPILVEDCHSLWMGETPLFNLLNQSMRSQLPLLMTAALPLDQWTLQTQDVRSRLRLALNLEITPLDDAHLAQLFVKLFDDRQLQIDPGLIPYLLSRMERSPAHVVSLVEMMDQMSLERQRPISKRLAGDALARLYNQ
jgi:chromosomal replication initiation ATPase DnaA